MTVAGFGVLLAGCYALQPAAGVVPAPGTEVAFDINDVGRVALGGTMGPEISQVAGRLASKDGEEYVVNVTSVQLLRGGSQVWRGEQVRIKPSYVSAVYERKFSRGRTIVFAAAGLGAVAYFTGKALAASAIDIPDTAIDSVTLRRGRRPERPFQPPPFLRRLNPPRSY